MIDMAHELPPLLIVCGLAFIIPFIASRFPYFEIPVIVAEIIAGILLGGAHYNLFSVSGTTIAGALRDSPFLEFLSLFGFAFLMFLSGIEIDFTQIKTTRIIFEKDHFVNSITRDPLYLGIIYFIMSLVLCYIVAVFLAPLGVAGSPILLALVFTTTSVGVVVPTLHHAGIIKTEYGQNILLASLVADFSTMLLITVAFASLTTGFSPYLLLIGFLFVAFFAVYKLNQLITEESMIKKALMKGIKRSTEIRVRGSFALMLLFIVMAQVLGAEMILGAFLAGALISLVISRKETKALQQKLNGAGYGFFIPIFFIMVGVRMDLEALLASPVTMILTPLLIMIAFVVKLVPAHFFTNRYGPKKAMAAGVLMSARLTLIIAVASIGLEIGAIDEAMNSAIILVAVVTSIVSPAIFSHLAKDFKKTLKKKKKKGKIKKPVKEEMRPPSSTAISGTVKVK
jgi:Kef-type K+ transport system membrane component KefB